MSDEADQFRSRAKQCRDLATSARYPTDRQTLNDMADDLDSEAARIDGEQAPQDAADRLHLDDH